MNGPVIRELEKRKQREALMERLQTRASSMNHPKIDSVKECLRLSLWQKPRAT